MALHLFFVVASCLCLVVSVSSSSEAPSCLLYNFGDSNSDTGGFWAVFGIILRGAPIRNTTYRANNGFVYLDFLCESLGTSHLSPYLGSDGSNFSNGVNFAVSTMTAQPFPERCFPLSKQVEQFVYFQNRTFKGKREEFNNAIFSVDIGQNDIYYSLSRPHEEVVNIMIPNALASIEGALKLLHEHGARKFLIYSTRPIGCLPGVLRDLQKHGIHLPLDKMGCVEEYNEYSMVFNRGLASMLDKLRLQLWAASVIHVDMYAIKYDLIANASRYGLHDPLVPCLHLKKRVSTICLDPSGVVNWDGIHYTEAADKIVASKIMSGDYTSPYKKVKDLCEEVINE